jgi:hypothetical protein
MQVASLLEPEEAVRAWWFDHVPIHALGGMTAIQALAAGRHVELINQLAYWVDQECRDLPGNENGFLTAGE